MFKQTRRKLSVFYAASFFLFFLIFIVILYFSLVTLMKQQQLEELETYYAKQHHDFFEHFHDDDDDKIEFDSNRTYFYYIYSSNQTFIHGDENYKGLYNAIEKEFQSEDTSESIVKIIQWDDEHLLLLSKPITDEGNIYGYIIVGKSITSQYHFFQKMIWLFVVITLISTLFIGFISYFMAGKAMVPIQKSFEKQKKFVSDASHELRTPLSIFYSSLDILKEDEAKNLSPFGKELIDDLMEESELMKSLLEKLLFLARHDQNRLEMKMETIELSNMLNNIAVKFERTLPNTISLLSEIEENVQYVGDVKRINELIYILLENAAQYTQQGSITLKLSKTDNSIKIFVEDTGIGISKEDIPHIFDRFYRSDTARKRTGTGLGLSIAKAIVEEHGGTIHVTSELGKGTSFCIQLPITIQK